MGRWVRSAAKVSVKVSKVEEEEGRGGGGEESEVEDELVVPAVSLRGGAREVREGRGSPSI